MFIHVNKPQLEENYRGLFKIYFTKCCIGDKSNTQCSVCTCKTPTQAVDVRSRSHGMSASARRTQWLWLDAWRRLNVSQLSYFSGNSLQFANCQEAVLVRIEAFNHVSNFGFGKLKQCRWRCSQISRDLDGARVFKISGVACLSLFRFF